jgi:hypothetical protein
MCPSDPTHPTVITVHGPRHAEDELRARVAAVLPTSPADLGTPVRIIVPSGGMRNHVLRRLADWFGGAAGVVVQTLFGVAREVVEGRAESLPAGPIAFRVAVRRALRSTNRLRQLTDSFSGSDDLVVGAVRDLVDAGITTDHLDHALEAVDACSAGDGDRERAVELLRMAAHLAEAEPLLPGQTMAMAARIVSDDPDVLQARSLILHGVADVTGLAADWLQVLVRRPGASVILDRPMDPSRTDTEDAGTRFLERLQDRVGFLDPSEARASRPPPAALELEVASDAEDEAWAVVARLRGAIEAGMPPESCAVVVPHGDDAVPVFTALEAAGVPWSCEGITAPAPLGERSPWILGAWLRDGAGTPVEQWLGLFAGAIGSRRQLLALRTLGVRTVADLIALSPTEVPPEGVTLPWGRTEAEDDDSPAEESRVPAVVVLSAGEVARHQGAILEGWPDAEEPDGWGAHLRRLAEALASMGAEGAARELRDVAAECVRALTVFSTVTRADLVDAVVRCLRERAVRRPGGAGGGVQVLTLMESRGRAHALVCSVGLCRGAVPRSVAEDPLLSEPVRMALAAVLPEIPVKGRSADEQRYLFAQLCASAERVALSWPRSSGGRPTARSAFVARLERAGRCRQHEVKPTRSDLDMAASMTVDHGPSAVADAVAAMAERGPERTVFAIAVGRPEAIGSARAAVVRSLEASAERMGPGPWSGFLAVAPFPADDLWVTFVEAFARCPLQTFITRKLGVGPMPDPRFALPDLAPLLVGRVVHGVLQAVVDEARGERIDSLGRAVTAPGMMVSRPDDAWIDDRLEGLARSVLAREGLGRSGLGALLVARARPYVDTALDLEWSDGPLEGVLAAEVQGEVSLPDDGPVVRFRADRVDRPAIESFRIIDYKTAKPFADYAKEETRRGHLARRIATGQLLQAAAYALAVRAHHVEGAYRYLDPRPVRWSEARSPAVAAADVDLVDAFRAAVDVVADALGQRVVPAHMETAGGDEGVCGYCPVRDACRRDDTASRRRLRRWLESSPVDPTPAERAVRRVLEMGDSG